MKPNIENKFTVKRLVDQKCIKINYGKMIHDQVKKSLFLKSVVTETLLCIKKVVKINFRLKSLQSH